MAGKFSFTFRLGDAGQSTPTAAAPERSTAAASPDVSAAGPLSATVPGLASLDLFPTRIWQARPETLAPHRDRWVREVLAMRANSPKPAGRTNRQGWNSVEMSVLDRPEFSALHQVVRAACSAALGEMGVGDRPFYLQSWVNLHDRGGFNFLHLHEGSLLSGSFYLQVPPGSGEFVFRDPRPGVIHGAIKGVVPNGHSDIHLTPSPGLLVLFPCWMEHYVEPHDNDEPRIAISFNALEGEAKAPR